MTWRPGRVHRISLGLHLHQPIDQQSPSPTRLRGFALIFHIIEKGSAVECESRHGFQSPQEEPSAWTSLEIPADRKIKRTPCRVFASPVAFQGERASLDGKPGQIRVMIFEIAADRFHGGPNPTLRADIDSRSSRVAEAASRGWPVRPARFQADLIRRSEGRTGESRWNSPGPAREAFLPLEMRALAR
jgi:hypothetical protein